MSDCKTFHGVDLAGRRFIKKSSGVEHGTVYDPSSGNNGKATTNTAVGTIVVSFDLNPSDDSITYCIVSKPWIVSVSQIFDGVADSINACRKK